MHIKDHTLEVLASANPRVALETWDHVWKERRRRQPGMLADPSVAHRHTTSDNLVARGAQSKKCTHS